MISFGRKHRRCAGVLGRARERVVFRLVQIDRVLQTSVEQFGGEHERAAECHNRPLPWTESQRESTGDGDGGEHELDAEIRLLDERMIDAVHRIDHGVRERTIAAHGAVSLDTSRLVSPCMRAASRRS